MTTSRKRVTIGCKFLLTFACNTKEIRHTVLMYPKALCYCETENIGTQLAPKADAGLKFHNYSDNKKFINMYQEQNFYSGKNYVQMLCCALVPCLFSQVCDI